jgi:hypothetical protein
MTSEQLTLDDAGQTRPAQDPGSTVSVVYGRCRSGKRWFWIAAEWLTDRHRCDDPVCVYGGLHEYGWEDTEDLALEAISAAAARRGYAGACGRGSAGMASDALKRINAARRKARPPKQGATEAAPVEYLYVPCVHIPYDDYLAETRRWVQEVPVVKKTAKRIYYDVSNSWDRHEGTVTLGFIGREEFEADTRCQVRCLRNIPAGPVCRPHQAGYRHCVHLENMGLACYTPLGCGERCPADIAGWKCAEHGYTWDHCPHGQDPCRHGYPAGQIVIPGDRHRRPWDGWLFCATREAAEAELDGDRESQRKRQEDEPELKRLRMEMANAHPDRGGTNEGFIAARKRYKEALRRAS